MIFEPDSEAVSEALEWLRNNEGRVIHSYDPINDQENDDIVCQLETHDESLPDEVFNEQIPSHLAVNSHTNETHDPSAISIYHQPTEMSDDQLRESVRSLNEMQRKPYDKVLTWRL